MPMFVRQPEPNWEAAIVNRTLTKREQFAMASMQGLCANPAFSKHHHVDGIATRAIKQADELIKQLEKE